MAIYHAIYKSAEHLSLRELSFSTRATTCAGIIRAAIKAVVAKCGSDFRYVAEVYGDDLRIDGILFEIDSQNYGRDLLKKQGLLAKASR